jgi:hypothetical protein
MCIEKRLSTRVDNDQFTMQHLRYSVQFPASLVSLLLSNVTDDPSRDARNNGIVRYIMGNYSVCTN